MRARAQAERAELAALEELCAAAPESPRSAPLREALEGLARENARLRAALEEAGLQQEWVLGSVVKSSEADKAQLARGLRCARALVTPPLTPSRTWAPVPAAGAAESRGADRCGWPGGGGARFLHVRACWLQQEQAERCGGSAQRRGEQRRSSARGSCALCKRSPGRARGLTPAAPRARREMTDQRDALLQELKHSETQFAGMVAEALDERIRHLETVLLGRAPPRGALPRPGSHPALASAAGDAGAGADGARAAANRERTLAQAPEAPPPRAVTPPPLPLPPATVAALASVQGPGAPGDQHEVTCSPAPAAPPLRRRAPSSSSFVRPASVAAPAAASAPARAAAAAAVAAPVASTFVRPGTARAARRAAAPPDESTTRAAAAARPLHAGLALARGLFRRASAHVGGLLGAAGAAAGQAGHALAHAGQASAGRLASTTHAAPRALAGGAAGAARAGTQAAARLDGATAQVAAPLRRSSQRVRRGAPLPPAACLGRLLRCGRVRGASRWCALGRRAPLCWSPRRAGVRSGFSAEGPVRCTPRVLLCIAVGGKSRARRAPAPP